MTDAPRGGGARLMVGFHGTRPDDDLFRVLEETGARSVILFSRNIEDPNQTRDLVSGIRERISWPLMFAIDQEGGSVVRMTRGVTVFPGNMALGSAGNSALALAQGTESGRQLSALGFDINLAPVVDLQTNPTNPGIGIRSFGSDPEDAAVLAHALIEGHGISNVKCCLKHFPGKGAAGVDAHLELPVLDLSLEAFRHPHLDVFERLFASSPDAAVMTTHLLIRGIDPENPATLSRPVVTGLLREVMGFQGLVVSDDLEMKAIVDNHGIAHAAVASAHAGHDVLPVCHSLERQLEAAQSLDRSLKSGELSLEEHEASLVRIEASSSVSSAGGTVDTRKGDDIARQVAECAVHVFQDPQCLLPLDDGDGLMVLLPEPKIVEGVEEAAGGHWKALLDKVFAAAGVSGCAILAFDPEDDVASSEAIFSCRKGKRVLLLTWNALVQASHRRVIEMACEELSSRLIVAHIRNPFDQRLVPSNVTSLTTFGARDCQLEALGRVLFGGLKASGRLPAPIR